eukprot:m.113922 g.113922  ORF g.113922 m.113922 type:complete len:144 (-) comp28308_c1_seq1:69-500(-)
MDTASSSIGTCANQAANPGQSTPIAIDDDDYEIVEETYVVVQLDSTLARNCDMANIKLKNVHTATPTLVLKDGSTVKGSYNETIGTNAVFEITRTTTSEPPPQKPKKRLKTETTNSVRLVCQASQGLAFKSKDIKSKKQPKLE